MNDVSFLNLTHTFFWQDPEYLTSKLVKINKIYTDEKIRDVKELRELDQDTILLTECGSEILNSELFVCSDVYEYCLDHAEHYKAMPMDFMMLTGVDEVESFLLFDGIVECLTEEEHLKLSKLISKG